MTTLYEHYAAEVVPWPADIFGVNWISQNLTIGTVSANEANYISSLKLKIYRLGSPGTLTVSIKAVDGDGKPTGPDLSTGTTNGNTLGTGTYEVREILMSAFELQKNTTYAIVLRAISGDASNKIIVLFDLFGTYTGGDIYASGDSGSTWLLNDGYDLYFYQYGYSGAMTTNRGYWGVK